MSTIRHLTGLAAVAALVALPAAAAPAAPLPAGTTALLSSGGPSLLDPLPAPAGPSLASDRAASDDGDRVAFTSHADGLVDGDDDRVANVYVKELSTGRVILASRAHGPGGEPAHDDCRDAAISGDGRRVAFVCEGPLDPADGNGTHDVYLRDLESGATVLVSRASQEGAVGDGPSRDPSLSQAGDAVAFSSVARNLAAGATDGQSHVFRRAIGGGDPTAVVSRRSEIHGGGVVPGTDPSISDAGHVIAFTHVGGGPVVDPNDGNGSSVPDVYAYSVPERRAVLASRANGGGAGGDLGSHSPALAGDASAVAFVSHARGFSSEDTESDPDIYRRTLTGPSNAQVTTLVSLGGERTFRPSIDDDGDVVGFVARGTGLDPADQGAAADAYVRDLTAGTTSVVSRGDGVGGPVDDGDVQAVAVSGSGRRAVVTLTTGRIVPGADPRTPTVALRDLPSSRTLAVARPPGSAPFLNTGGTSYGSALSADGRFAAFVSDAPGLGLPAGARSGIFLRDRVTGDTTLVSRADGPDGAPMHGVVESPAVSADGGRVAFVASTEPSATPQVWVRDVRAGRTFLASRADGAAGTPGDEASYSPSLDADGSRVAFSSDAANLSTEDRDPTGDAFVRDLDEGRTLLASRADGPAGAGGDGDSGQPALDDGGTRVAFSSAATNLGGGDTDADWDVHLRDLAAGTTRIVSAAPDGTQSDGHSRQPSIDAAGTRVAFVTSATTLAGAGQPGGKILVRDLAAGTLVAGGRADGADGAVLPVATATAPALSPDGGHVAFVAGSPVPRVLRRDLAAGRTVVVMPREGLSDAARGRYVIADDISRDGSCVSFSTDDALFGPPSEHQQVYLRALDADCARLRGGGASGDGSGGGAGGAGRARPGGDGADRTAPVLSGLRLTPARVRTGARAVLGLRSSEAATVTVTVERVAPGRRASGRCRPVRRRVRRGGCDVHRALGTLTRRASAGPVRLTVGPRAGSRRLTPGRHRLTVTARDEAGNRSRPVRLAFVVVPARRPRG